MAKTQQVAVIEQVRGTLDKMTPQFKAALPAHVPPEKFVRVAMTAVTQNPDLLACDRTSLLASCMKAAQDGLLPDGREAALVKFGDKVAYMPMIAGILKKVRNSGELESIAAHVVYERDEFDYELGDDERIKHKPSLEEERGAPMLAYAIAKTKDGGIYREIMLESQLQAVRKVSRSKGGPWDGPFADEMRRKTVLRRLAKRLPMSTDLEDTIRADDELYDPAAAPAAQPTPLRDVTARPAALQHVVDSAPRAEEPPPPAENYEDADLDSQPTVSDEGDVL